MAGRGIGVQFQLQGTVAFDPINNKTSHIVVKMLSVGGQSRRHWMPYCLKTLAATSAGRPAAAHDERSL